MEQFDAAKCWALEVATKNVEFSYALALDIPPLRWLASYDKLFPSKFEM